MLYVHRVSMDLQGLQGQKELQENRQVPSLLCLLSLSEINSTIVLGAFSTLNFVKRLEVNKNIMGVKSFSPGEETCLLFTSLFFFMLVY